MTLRHFILNLKNGMHQIANFLITYCRKIIKKIHNKLKFKIDRHALLALSSAFPGRALIYENHHMMFFFFSFFESFSVWMEHTEAYCGFGVGLFVFILASQKKTRFQASLCYHIDCDAFTSIVIIILKKAAVII